MPYFRATVYSSAQDLYVKHCDTELRHFFTKHTTIWQICHIFRAKETVILECHTLQDGILWCNHQSVHTQRKINGAHGITFLSAAVVCLLHSEKGNKLSCVNNRFDLKELRVLRVKHVIITMQ